MTAPGFADLGITEPDEPERDPHASIGGVNALIFAFALSLVAIGAAVAIVVAVITGYWILWFIAIGLLGLGVWALYDGLKNN